MSSITIQPYKSDVPFDSTKIERKFLWRGANLFYNVLTPEECAYYIKQMDAKPHESLDWDQGRRKYRINDRVQAMCPEVSAIIWERVKPFLINGSFDAQLISAEKYVDGNQITDDGKKTIDITTAVSIGTTISKILGCPSGIYEPYGLNSLIRYCRYQVGGLFGRHYDGSYCPNTRERSLFTFMFYLNDEYEGGATRLLDDGTNPFDKLVVNDQGEIVVEGPDGADERSNVKAIVGPLKPGMLVVFPQHLYHDGTAVTSGVKYIMRTDVMFRRIGDLPNTNLQENEKELEADQLLILAENLERSGNADEAAKIYKKAFTMSSRLAKQFGY